MVKPKRGESYREFVGRFMKDKDMVKEYPDFKKRFSVMASEWRKNDNTI